MEGKRLSGQELRNFQALEISTLCNALKIVKYNSQEIVKKASVVFIGISLPGGQFRWWTSAGTFMASRSMSSKMKLFCAISHNWIR